MPFKTAGGVHFITSSGQPVRAQCGRALQVPCGGRSAAEAGVGPQKMSNALVCNTCKSEQLEAGVEYGSYVLRCAKCGANVVATSFLAMRTMDTEFAAYHDPGYGKALQCEALIARGPLQTIYEAVRAAANGGSFVRLVPAQPGVSIHE